MDKKNFLIGISLLVVAFVLMFQKVEEAVPHQSTAKEDDANNTARPDSNNNTGKSAKGDDTTSDRNTSGVTQIQQEPDPSHGNPLLVDQRKEPEIKIWNPNKNIEVVFTSEGGAIREIRLKATNRIQKDYVFKYPLHPALEVSFENLGDTSLPLPDFSKYVYDIEVAPDNSSVTCKNITNGVEIRREYWQAKEDPYLIRHSTEVINNGNAPLPWKNLRLEIGMARPIANRKYNPMDPETYLNIGYYNAGKPTGDGCSGCKLLDGCSGCRTACADCSGRIDGEEEEFWQVGEIPEGGLSKTLSHAKWACVNNRFFVNIIRPDEENKVSENASYHIKGGPIGNIDKIDAFKEEGYATDQYGISASFSLPFGTVEKGKSAKVEITYYAGPKDYMRLQKIEGDQKAVMQFGVFWWVSEPLNAFLNLLYGWLGDFGVAIIVMTICVKLVLWPLTAKSVRSQRKMQQLQEPMQALRERYKSNPQKLNQEMMKFYKQQGVNPLAGCWPMLIQIPIFLGLFWMLRSAAELQGATFLWIDDLSDQDNIANLGSYSLNLLPLFMVVTQIIQMKITPMNLGPNASDQQRIQAKMMRMMPYMFLVFLYFFSSALVLYWTVQNILSIVQALITKRSDNESPSPTIATEEPKGKTKTLDSAPHVSQEESMHRKVLGLRLRGDLSKKEIKVAFKERIKRFHPDKIRNLGAKRQGQAEEKRKKLELAYEFLLNKG